MLRKLSLNKMHFNIILLYSLDLVSGLVPSDFQTKILYAFLVLPCI
jgi:hypothetical protein